MNKTVVVAIGGNSLILEKQEGTILEQVKNAETTCREVVKLIKAGYRVVVTHGNGPQVGNILMRIENTSKLTYDIPLDYCGAMSQGELGYLLSNVFQSFLAEEGICVPVVSVITRTLVNQDDPAFKNPTKPIGKFYSKEEADELASKNGYIMKEDSGRGFRQVVASPKPCKIVELDAIKSIITSNMLVIACGGGGIPVVEKNGRYEGVAAVIDKDMTSSLLASEIEADYFFVSTGVECAYVDFGTDNQRPLHKITVDEVETYINKGDFKEGSMKPKIMAAINFVRNGGKAAVITSPNKISEAFDSDFSGTVIVL